MACMSLETANFVRKGFDLVASASGGIMGGDRHDITSIVASGYRSHQEYSNNRSDFLEVDMIHLLSIKYDPQTLKRNIAFVPWKQKLFSKGRHLQVMVAFADQHRSSYPDESFPPHLARQFVDNVLDASRQKHQQITLTEQLDIALQICPDSILGASIVAHAGCRSIAKNSDTRISTLLEFTKEQIGDWRDSVSTFSEITGNYGSPPADTYHFWGTFVAGLVSTTVIHKKDIILNPAYQFLYTNMAEITNILRYKIARRGDGACHKQVDILGYHLGSYVADHLLTQI